MVIILFPLIILSSFLEWFSIEKTFSIPPDQSIPSVKCSTYRHYFAVMADGKTAVYIDPSGRCVKSFDLISGTFAERSSHTTEASSGWGPVRQSADTMFLSGPEVDVASFGRKAGQVNTPLALTCDRGGNLLVSDLGNRRVLLFDTSLSFLSSFLVPTVATVPSNVLMDESGDYVVANLLLDTTSSINSGFHCCVLSATGALLAHFAPTPTIAFERNLWLGVCALIDRDDDHNVYVAFSVDPTICVYNRNRVLTSCIDVKPAWWRPPPILPQSRFQVREEPTDFLESWTRIVKLLYVERGVLLVVAETNGQIEGCATRFIMDIYTTDGQVLVSGVGSDYLPVGTDRDGYIYFLSLSGDKLLRTTLMREQEE